MYLVHVANTIGPAVSVHNLTNVHWCNHHVNHLYHVRYCISAKKRRTLLGSLFPSALGTPTTHEYDHINYNEYK